MKKTLISTSIAILMAIGSAGCAVVPNDAHLVNIADLSHVTVASDIKLATEGWPEARWWSRYADPHLDRYIEMALEASPSMQVAMARIGAAQAALQMNEADRDGKAGAGFSANRQRYSANGLLPPPIGGHYYNEETLGLRAAYEFDWWGKHRSQVEAAAGELNARRAEYANAQQVLASSIAMTYFSMQYMARMEENAKAQLELEKRLMEEKLRRIERGLATQEVQHSAEIRIAVLREQIVQHQTELKKAREALRALAGMEGQVDVQTGAKQSPALEPGLPASFSYELLRRRPDLQASLWRVQAAIGREGVAKAAFYPDLTITASLGFDSLSIDKLLSAASRSAYLGPSLSLPIFDGKALRSRLSATREDRNAAISQYNQDVINAVRDVAQSAAMLQGALDQVAQQRLVLFAAQSVVKSAKAKFDNGLSDKSSVAEAELSLLRQQAGALQLENQVRQAEVLLAKALGGGYRVDAGMPINRDSDEK